MIYNHWLRITHHDSQPLAQNNTPSVTTTGSASLTIIHNHWLRVTQHDSQPLAKNNTP
jgi:hypothetical protein